MVEPLWVGCCRIGKRKLGPYACWDWLGQFVEHLVGESQNKGLTNPTKIYPNPLQKYVNPTQKIHAHSVFTVCVCNKQKNLEKIWGFGEIRFLVRNMEMGVKWTVGGSAVVRGGGAKVARW
jgi:hypothetical protein